jgi:hypothetical protein
MSGVLYLAWKDPVKRRWYPIGRLTFRDGCYEFVYTHGVVTARRESAFEPIPLFPDFHRIYPGDDLFPLFRNRIFNPKRPEYRDHIRFLDIDEESPRELRILARSGGARATDTFEVFGEPELRNGWYRYVFFARAIDQLPEESRERILQLQPGDRLYLIHDFQNPADSNALLLRTAGDKKGDWHLTGFCPRYVASDLGRLGHGSANAHVTVRQVNDVPAPMQLRLLCELKLKAQPGFEPFAGEEFQPLVLSEPELAPL